ncbi:hypothetical protein PDUR_23595 [Paenibacillus durus]|uniref:Uncharacterized protein n=2 Tax=Paenibacillus durus TaxID=44251 RepID=A0A089J024_PAEDU|nr:hypothetical protein PDUR_23595 [Paenibacillus durus]
MKKSNYFTVLVFISVIFFCISCGNRDEKIVYSAGTISLSNENYMQIKKISEDNFKLTLFDKTHQVIFEEEYPKEPMTKILSNNVIQVTISLGSPNRYVFFYDTESTKISNTFYNPILIESGNILFLDDEGKLIFRDIFDQSLLYTKIIRDFSPTAVPSNAIYKAELLENTLYIEYYEGPEFKEKKENIKVK